MECGARYYDPETGSFLTRDTDLSQSPYAYCGGDPVNFTDPSGHDMTTKEAAGWGLFGVGLAIEAGGLAVLATAATIVALPALTFVVGVALLVGITGFAVSLIGDNFIADGRTEENKKSGDGNRPDPPEPVLPKVQDPATATQRYWNIFVKGDNGTYYYKGSSSTNPGLPTVPAGSTIHY